VETPLSRNQIRKREKRCVLLIKTQGGTQRGFSGRGVSGKAVSMDAKGFSKKLVMAGILVSMLIPGSTVGYSGGKESNLFSTREEEGKGEKGDTERKA